VAGLCGPGVGDEVQERRRGEEASLRGRREKREEEEEKREEEEEKREEEEEVRIPFSTFLRVFLFLHQLAFVAHGFVWIVLFA
jgi:hypothetical protein